MVTRARTWSAFSAAVAAAAALARDRRGEIRAPYDGFVLLPLYQAQGSDGFFYGKAAAPPAARPPTNPHASKPAA